MSDLLIKNVDILTMEEPITIIKNGEIACSSQHIAYAGPAGTVPAGFKAGRVIDGTGKLAMPGLINCHTHTAMTLFRGYADDMTLMDWLKGKIWPLEDMLEEEDVYWGTLLGCVEMIRAGVTTFADMYFYMRHAARAVMDSGLRASLSRGLIGVAPNGEEALADSRSFVSEWNCAADGRITVMLGPHAPYTCPPDYLKKVIQAACELDVGIHIHLCETLDEIRDIAGRYDGKTPIKLMEEMGLFDLKVLAAHCVHLTDDDINILSVKKVGVAHNPESNMKLASGVAPVIKLLAGGVEVGLGTDGAASNNNLDVWEELRAASFLQKVNAMDPTAVPALQALKMAITGGAKVLGMGSKIGMIKSGYKADIILVDLQQPHLYPRHDIIAHLAYASRSSDVDTVVVDGRILMEGRKVLTVDEEKLFAEVQKRADRLAGR